MPWPEKPTDVLPDFEAPQLVPEWHDDTTVKLGELIEGKWLDWSAELFGWSEVAYSPEQYERVCKAFEMRFYYREISMLPPKRWAMRLMYKIRYEIAPACNALYKAVEGANPLADFDEYGKRRDIDSEYPETMLSGNADFLSSGKDSEYETIKTGNMTDALENAAEKWKTIDQLFLDKCECMFSDLVNNNVNY